MDEAEDRKARSIAKLVELGVPYIEHLPPREMEAQTHRRAQDEVGLRMICLALVSMKGAGADPEFVLEGARYYDVENDFSEREMAFVRDSASGENEKLQYAWRVECAHTLLWSVGMVDALSLPTCSTDWNAFWGKFHDSNREAFLSDLKLRPQAELLDETDLIYRLHWATREADLTGQLAPAQMNHDVIMERHHALNWLTCPLEAPYLWDDISDDT